MNIKEELELLDKIYADKDYIGVIKAATAEVIHGCDQLLNVPKPFNANGTRELKHTAEWLLEKLDAGETGGYFQVHLLSLFSNQSIRERVSAALVRLHIATNIYIAFAAMAFDKELLEKYRETGTVY